MSLLTNVHADNKRERKLSVLIFNFIIFIMSFFIVIFYATQPFFQVRAGAELTKETLAEIIQFDDEEIDVAELLDEGVELKLELTIPADLMFDTAAKVLNKVIFYFNLDVDVSAIVDELINESVDSLVDQLLPTIENIALKAAKQIAINKGKDALLNALTQGNAENNALFEEKLEQAGINEEYFDEKMTTVTDALQAEGATPESVADTVVNVMNTVVADLQTKEDTDLHIENIDTTTLKQTVVEALETFTTEDGTIDLDSAIAELFNKMLESESNESASAKTGNAVALLSTVAEETQDDSVEELKQNVREKLMSVIDENTHNSICMALKIASIVLIFSMTTWVYLMVKIIAKLFAKDKTVKLKLPILFGGLPGLLWLIPSMIMHFTLKNPNVIANPYNLQLAFAASGWIAIMGALVLIVISAPYSALRNSLTGRKLRKFK
ncbi:MAG: hypothetical protein IKA72_05115 [Clostridia bacterium]|nr:hypothetical protein [Clostridia bacterium]